MPVGPEVLLLGTKRAYGALFAFLMVLIVVLSFGPKERHMSWQRWRATSCDGADSSARGFLSVPLQPLSGKLAPSPARGLCAIAGEGGGRGILYLLESEK